MKEFLLNKSLQKALSHARECFYLRSIPGFNATKAERDLVPIEAWSVTEYVRDDPGEIYTIEIKVTQLGTKVDRAFRKMADDS